MLRRILLGILVLTGWLVGGQNVYAATGTLYLQPATSTTTAGAEVSVALRVNPGTDIQGVQANIGYDASKLQFIDVNDAGTAFPLVLEQSVKLNPITLTRGSESMVNTDSFVITVRFKALASSGTTAVSLSGNAGTESSTTNPAVQGAVITFGSATSPSPNTPSPTSPSQPSAQNPGSSTPQETIPNTSPPIQTTAEQQMPSSFTQIQHSPLSRRFWWAGALGGVLLICGSFWLIRHRNGGGAADLAAAHPVDTTWANPAAKVQDPANNQLLGQARGVNNPDPGSIVTPKDPHGKP